MAAAKEYKEGAVYDRGRSGGEAFRECHVFHGGIRKAGILNFKLDEAYLADYVAKMQADEGRYGCERDQRAEDDHDRLRRTERGEAASRRTSALGDHRREHQSASDVLWDIR